MSSDRQTMYLDNRTSNTVHISYYHGGCGKMPWINGKPRCHTSDVVGGSLDGYEVTRWAEWGTFIVSILVDVVVLGVETAIVVVTGGAAAPAEEETIEAMLGEFLGQVAEATGESTASVLSTLASSSAAAFTSAASSMGLSAAQLGEIIAAAGVDTALIVGEAQIEAATGEWDFYLTNNSKRIYQPQHIVVDTQNNNNVLMVVPDDLRDWKDVTSELDLGHKKSKDLPGYE